MLCITFLTLLCLRLPSIRADGPCPNIPPVAAFTYSPNLPYSQELVTFNATESDDPNGFIFSYTWDFGDGNTSTFSVPLAEHPYEELGEYNVTLTVMDNLGATNSTMQTLCVRSHVLALFSYFPPNPYVRQIITYDASNSTTTTGTILNYEWDFGDGNVTIVETTQTSHYYTEAREFTVTLNVTDTNGEWDIETHAVNVTVPPIRPPEAAFSWLPTIPEAGQTVNFDASESAPNGGEIVSYSWDFGDGKTQTTDQTAITHTFEHYGNYSVSLTVTDTESLSDTVNHVITVIEKPIADFFFVPEEPRQCTVVTVNASISDARGGEIVSYEWIFGDNSTIEFGAVITHRFKMGEHSISLNVTDSENLWSIKNITIKVLPHIADLNEDGVVNILDITIFAGAYGSFPGHSRYLLKADLDRNSIINILDGVVIARAYNMCIDPFDC